MYVSCGIYHRRTGVPLNIDARKDSFGFDNIDDYFPDSGICCSYQNKSAVTTVTHQTMCDVKNVCLAKSSLQSDMMTIQAGFSIRVGGWQNSLAISCELATYMLLPKFK